MSFFSSRRFALCIVLPLFRQGFFDTNIKALGVQNAYFPLFVSKSALEAEKEHVEVRPEQINIVTSGSSCLPDRVSVPRVLRPRWPGLRRADKAILPSPSPSARRLRLVRHSLTCVPCAVFDSELPWRLYLSACAVMCEPPMMRSVTGQAHGFFVATTFLVFMRC